MTNIPNASNTPGYTKRSLPPQTNARTLVARRCTFAEGRFVKSIVRACFEATIAKLMLVTVLLDADRWTPGLLGCFIDIVR